MATAVEEISFSPFTQVAARYHTHMMMCFGLDKSESHQLIAAHLSLSLEKLAKQRPDFTDRLETVINQSGGKSTRRVRTGSIPFEAVNMVDSFPWTFDYLEDQGFPASAFLEKRFTYAMSPNEVDPGILVKAFFINGGVLLTVYVSHQIADGNGVSIFLDCFAAQTRGDTASHPTNLLLPVLPLGRRQSIKTLIRQCDEYKVGTLDPPTELPEPLTGRILVFSMERLGHLQRNMNEHSEGEHLSLIVCLSSLIWVYVTCARISSFGPDKPFEVDIERDHGSLVHLVNWQPRAFTEATKTHFGNTVTSTTTMFKLDKLLETARMSGKTGTDSLEALTSKVARPVAQEIKKVNEQYMTPRIQLAERVVESRGTQRLTWNVFDSVQNPGDIVFNTWRFLAADTEWNLSPPAVSQISRKPAALRRPAEGWWSPNGIVVMPQKQGANTLEVLVQLLESEMENLLHDENFMMWVAKVVR